MPRRDVGIAAAFGRSVEKAGHLVGAVTVSKACNYLTIVFGLLYAVALALLLIGTYGLFGREKDPLSAVFLIPLGWPWNRLLDSFPEASWPWLAAGAPLVNLAILVSVCLTVARMRVRTPQ